MYYLFLINDKCIQLIFWLPVKREDKVTAALANLVSELKQDYAMRGLLLSTAVSLSKKIIDMFYDVPALPRHVMTSDYHGNCDKKTGHVSPLYHHPEDDFFYSNKLHFNSDI